MSKIIVTNSSSRLDDVSALWYVQQVIEAGKGENKNYPDKIKFDRTRVYVTVKASEQSDSFVVRDLE